MRRHSGNPARTAWIVIAGLLALMLLFAGCGSSDDDESTAELQKIGKPEGQVNLIAWAGYVEDGSTEPGVDWVTEFEKETGCQVNVKIGSIAKQKNSPLERMKQKIDSTLGRHTYSMRLGIVEPVFGHINDAIGIKRFTLRSKKKVNGQWLLMTMLHNMTKIHRFGTI